MTPASIIAGGLFGFYALFLLAFGMNLIKVDMAWIFLVPLSFTGVFWGLERWAKRNRTAQPGQEAAAKKGRSWLVQQGAAVFIPLLIIFVVRFFILDMMRVPSGSMLPTIQLGDRILVNRLAYGPRVPLSTIRFFGYSAVAPGDVITFDYPVDPTTTYVKRVVGLPGDEVTFASKRLFVNGVLAPSSYLAERMDESTGELVDEFRDQLGDHSFVTRTTRSFPEKATLARGPIDGCTTSATGISCLVPPGHYFVMGDNRDGSFDSRSWGFVPFENISGKAIAYGLNAKQFSRYGFF